MASLLDPPIHDFPDRAHRQLLEHPRNLGELVQQVAPEVAARLDFDHSRLLRRDLILPDWRNSENDLLFEIPFRQADPEAAATTLVNVLVEHQSKADPAMPLRTLLEATLHWTTQWQAWKKSSATKQPLRLSPLLAIVFHTGAEAWKSYHSLADLIQAPPEFQAHVPSWKPLFWHVLQQPPEALLQASGEWLRAMALVRLKGAPADEFARAYAMVARSLEPLAERDKMRWHQLMEFLLGWSQYSGRSKAEIIRLHAITEVSHQNIALREEIQTMSQAVEQTWVEWAKTHYTAEGKALGEALGEARGVLRARREDLRFMLEERFGPLPEDLVRRIEASDDLARLQNAIRQVLHLKSLNEFQL